MTEVEWLACDDPRSMLDYLQVKAGNRKLRLFACACCHRIKHLLNDMCFAAVETAERYADSLVTRQALETAFNGAVQTTDGSSLPRRLARLGQGVLSNAVQAAIGASDSAYQSAGQFHPVIRVSTGTINALRLEGAKTAKANKQETGYAALLKEERIQCKTLRDIFGNPFRPLPPRPEAIAPLAERIYAGEWALMPLLGQWLQENGYWSEGEHCLDPKNQHVKGCWVVDWVTGRE
jgi:hypothetical protein